MLQGFEVREGGSDFVYLFGATLTRGPGRAVADLRWSTSICSLTDRLLPSGAGPGSSIFAPTHKNQVLRFILFLVSIEQRCWILFFLLALLLKDAQGLDWGFRV